jgi:F-type H+-transporting ATPase subunit epsilon
MNRAYKLEVVSLEGKIFSGLVKKIQVSGGEGQLGILHGHAPLLTSIKPGMVAITTQYNKKEFIYLSGGLLEVQPLAVSILADLAVRGSDLDEDRAIKEKKDTERKMEDIKYKMNMANLSTELAKSVAKLKVIELTKRVN